MPTPNVRGGGTTDDEQNETNPHRTRGRRTRGGQTEEEATEEQNTQPTSPHRTRGGSAEESADLDQAPTEQKRMDDTFKEVSQSSDRSVDETRAKEQQPVEPHRTRGQQGAPRELPTSSVTRARADPTRNDDRSRPPGRSGPGGQNPGFEAVERSPTNDVVRPRAISFREPDSTEDLGDVDWSLGQGGPEDEVERGLTRGSDWFRETGGDVARSVGGPNAEAFVEPVAGELNPAQMGKDLGEAAELFHRSGWEDMGIRDKDGGLGEFDQNPSVDFREDIDAARKGVRKSAGFAKENPYEAAGIGTAVGLGVVTGGVSGRAVRRARSSSIDDVANIDEPTFKTRAQLGPAKSKGSKGSTSGSPTKITGSDLAGVGRTSDISRGGRFGDRGPSRVENPTHDRPKSRSQTKGEGTGETVHNLGFRSSAVESGPIDPELTGVDGSVLGSTVRGGAAGGLLSGPKSRIEAAESTSFTDDDLDRSAGLAPDVSPITNTRSKQTTSLRDSWLDRAASRQDTKPESIDQELDKRFNDVDTRTDTTTDITTRTDTTTRPRTTTDLATDLDVVTTPTTRTPLRSQRPHVPERTRTPHTPKTDRPRTPPLDISLPDEKKKRRRGDDLVRTEGAWTNPIVGPGELDESLDLALGGIDDDLDLGGGLL